jgi:hypothetical protein
LPRKHTTTALRTFILNGNGVGFAAGVIRVYPWLDRLLGFIRVYLRLSAAELLLVYRRPSAVE